MTTLQLIARAAIADHDKAALARTLYEIQTLPTASYRPQEDNR